MTTEHFQNQSIYIVRAYGASGEQEDSAQSAIQPPSTPVAPPAAGRAIAGMETTGMGNTLTSSVFGAAAFAQPAMGQMFLAGQKNALEFYNLVYAAPLFGTILVSLLLSSLAAYSLVSPMQPPTASLIGPDGYRQ